MFLGFLVNDHPAFWFGPPATDGVNDWSSLPGINSGPSGVMCAAAELVVSKSISVIMILPRPKPTKCHISVWTDRVDSSTKPGESIPTTGGIDG